MEKSLTSVYIVEILKEYSDKDNPLTQAEIIQKLDTAFNVQIERKAVGRALKNLEDAGFPIDKVPNKGYYYERDFDPSELRYLIDGVLFSKHISANYAQEIIRKLKKLGGERFSTDIYKVVPPSAIKRIDYVDGATYFLNIEQLTQAITEGKKVSFNYNRYDIKKKLIHVFADKATVDPYALCVINNVYYLVGKLNVNSEVQRFRVAMITDLEVLDVPRDIGKENINFDVGKFVGSHPYFYGGVPTQITFRISNNIVNEVIDAFYDYSLMRSEGETSIINVNATLTDAEYFARRFGGEAEVLSPQSLRDKMRAFADFVYEKYVSFKADRYAEAVYKAKKVRSDRSPSGGSLILADIDVSDKREHEELKGVTEVFLSKNNVTDVSFLKNYTELKDLYIENNAIIDLSALVSCKGLEKLSLIDTKVSDLSFLKGLKNLQYLRLENNAATDFTPLYDCFNLTEMTINIFSVLTLDLIKLKRGCPFLRITVPEITDIRSNLDKIMLYINNEDECQKFGFDKIKLLFKLFIDTPDVRAKRADDKFTKEDAQSVLDFIKGRKTFTRSDYYMGRSRSMSGVKTDTIFDWLIACKILSYDKQNETFTVL